MCLLDMVARSVPLEFLCFCWQKVLDVCAALEDALQVHPSPLHVNPHIKQDVDAIELVLPGEGLLLKHLSSKQQDHSAGDKATAQQHDCTAQQWPRWSYTVRTCTHTYNAMDFM